MSESLLYKLILTPDVVTGKPILVGRRRFILHKAIDRYLEAFV